MTKVKAGLRQSLPIFVALGVIRALFVVQAAPARRFFRQG